MSLAELHARARSVKRRFLGMYRRANAGHVGSSLSCADLAVFAAFAWMRAEDTLLLSKGHAAALLYALLAEKGVLSESDIATYYKDGTQLAAHPPATGKVPGIPFATGSLGHGLSLAAGMALAARLKGSEGRRIFCITSDGELDEGSSWEAALFLAHHRLRDVVWLIDRNGLQGFGHTEDVLRLEPLAAKLAAFGFAVLEADGHDFASLADARDRWERARQDPPSGPSVVICRTIKGKGLGALANTVDCHYLPMTEAQYQEALREVDATHGHQA